MSRGASNFLSETPEIYEIATEKPRVTQRSLLPGTRPAAAGEIGISPNVLVIDFPLMRAASPSVVLHVCNTSHTLSPIMVIFSKSQPIEQQLC
jgi:hypothetical protein